MIKKIGTFLWEKIFKRPGYVDEAKLPGWLRGYIPVIAVVILALTILLLLKLLGSF
jgi:hypothetical protein